MKQKTFDGRTIDFSEMSHQHLSNCVWFNRIQINFAAYNYNKGKISDDTTDDALFVMYLEQQRVKPYIKVIDERFDGEILPYRPLTSFPQEIEMVKKLCDVKEDGEIWLEDEHIGYMPKGDAIVNSIDDI
jgi:hypothetical protein